MPRPISDPASGRSATAREQVNAKARKLVLGVWDALERRAARAFVAGPELADALALVEERRQRSMAAAVCFWDDGQQPPKRVYVRCQAAQRVLSDQRDCYLSLKPPALGFDADLVAELAANGPLHFDSLEIESQHRSLALAERLMSSNPVIGLTLPGRWRRSVEDADRAAEMAARVRVVKGEWPDPSDPGRDPRAGFLEVIDRLVRCARRPMHGPASPRQRRSPTVAVATHDSRLARESLSRLAAAGVPAELEVLHGHAAGRAVGVARRFGVLIRHYVPYGHPWLPWSLAEVRVRPWLLPRIAWAALKPQPAARSHTAPGRARGLPTGAYRSPTR